MNVNGEPVYVGRDFGGRDIVLDSARIERFSSAIDDRNPLYDEVCPGLLLHSECFENLDWYLANLFGNLHARQEWELYRALPVGARVTTRGFIRDRYRKRDRDYVVKETWVLDEKGRLANRGITHQSFLAADADRQRDRPVVDKSREKQPTRRFDVGDGDGRSLEPVTKHVTESMCMAFSGPTENYHTNREAAQALGFPDIVVQGMMPTCFLSEVLTREYGRGWLEGGKMDVRLVNVLWGGESVSAHAKVTGSGPEAGRTRERLDVWVEKADGTKVVVGTAGALR